MRLFYFILLRFVLVLKKFGKWQDMYINGVTLIVTVFINKLRVADGGTR